MKKCVFLIFVVLFLMSGCDQGRQTVVVTFSDSEEVTGTSSNPVFDYVWTANDCREFGGSSGLFPMTPTPRGIMLRSSSYSVYSPSTGILTAACTDPMCEHFYISNPECPFGDSLRWWDAPVTDGEYLYYVHKYFILGENESSVDRVSVVRTDLYGEGLRELYSTKNELQYIMISNGSLYFMEYATEKGALLYRYDLSSGTCESPKINHSKGLMVSAYIPVKGIVYYVYKGSLYRCSPDFSSSEKLIDDFLCYTLFTDGKDLYTLRDAGMIKTDLETLEDSAVYTAPEGLYIEHASVTDEGIAFNLGSVELASKSSPTYEMIRQSGAPRKIFHYHFSDGRIEEYELGEDFIIGSFYVYHGIVYAQNIIKTDRSSSGTGVGSWYVFTANGAEPIVIEGT